MSDIYTIGHSNHPADRFLALLDRHGITAVADIRSQPYSRRFPQFRKRELARRLASAGLRYVFLGKELGARRTEPEAFVDGRVDFERVALLPAFRTGLGRVVEGAMRFRVALMCAEADPMQCHRAILVSPALQAQGVEVNHILADGSLLEHRALERRMVEMLAGGPDLFDDDPLKRAYRTRAAAMTGAAARKREG